MTPLNDEETRPTWHSKSHRKLLAAVMTVSVKCGHHGATVAFNEDRREEHKTHEIEASHLADMQCARRDHTREAQLVRSRSPFLGHLTRLSRTGRGRVVECLANLVRCKPNAEAHAPIARYIQTTERRAQVLMTCFLLSSVPWPMGPYAASMMILHAARPTELVEESADVEPGLAGRREEAWKQLLTPLLDVGC